MGIEIQSRSCHPSQTVQFTFQQPLQQWMLGLGYFNLAYAPGTNHWVQTLSISLQGNMPEMAQVGNVLDVTVQAQLMDHSGHTIDVPYSFILVVCVAVTGSADPGTVLANVPNIASGQSPQVQLPGSGSSYSVVTTCLSGLNLSYDTTDHMFQGAKAGCGINPQPGGEGVLSAVANIWDGSGHQAVTAAIDAGVLASSDAPPPFMAQQVTARNWPLPSPVQFPSAVGQAVVLIQSFNVQYASGDHSVGPIVVGCPTPMASGNAVNLGACYAATTDDQNNVSDNALSYVNLLVVAVP